MKQNGVIRYDAILNKYRVKKGADNFFEREDFALCAVSNLKEMIYTQTYIFHINITVFKLNDINLHPRSGVNIT